jgi:hypothetical protein
LGGWFGRSSSFTNAGGGAEITLQQSLPTLTDVILYLRQRMQVLYAGALAESLNMGSRNQIVHYKWKAIRDDAKDEAGTIANSLTALEAILFFGVRVGSQRCL